MKQGTSGRDRPKRIMYVCDPHKNAECAKQGCYLNKNANRFRLCASTSKMEYALLDIDGDPVLDFRYIQFLLDFNEIEQEIAEKLVNENVALRVARELKMRLIDADKLVNELAKIEKDAAGSTGRVTEQLYARYFINMVNDQTTIKRAKPRAKQTVKLDGTKLKIEMIKRGVTGRELMDKTGTSNNTIVRARKGEPLNQTTAEKIADALGVELENLLPDDK